MAKTITLNYEQATYTLEFTRRTVSELEGQGFNISEIGDKPVTMVPMLYEGAFLAHHRMAKNDIIWEIYEQIPDKEALLKALAEMYAEPIEALFDTKEVEGDEKNAITWKASWD